MKKSVNTISKFENMLKKSQKLSSKNKGNIKGGVVIVPITFVTGVINLGMDVYNWYND